jgi:outer membrane protein assembly factor BamB
MRRALLLLSVMSIGALAQPQGQVIWSHHGTDGIYSTIAIKDIDGDSLPEAIGAIYYANYPSDPRKVYCLSGRTGDSLWIADTLSAYGTWGNKGLDHAGDLNGDGIEDVLLGTVGTYISPGRACVALDGATGTNLWVFPFGQERGWCYCVRSFRTPDGAPVDIDGDGVIDMLAGAGGLASDRRGTAIALSGANGDSLWAFRPGLDGVQSLAPFVDISGDTTPEVLVAAGGNGYDNRVFCISGRTGDSLWAYETDNSVSDVEHIADVNGSGTDDCIAGGWADSVYCIEGSDGTLIWGIGIGRIIMELVPVRDVDGDSVDDVIVGSWNSSVYVLSGADGSFLWSGLVGNDVWSVDSLADVNGDGIPEVVAGCLGNGNGVVKVFDGGTGDVLWHYDFDERVYDVSGVPDLNGDDRADVTVGLQDHSNQLNHLYAFDGLPPSPVTEAGRPAARHPLVRSQTLAGVILLDLTPGTAYRMSVFNCVGQHTGSTFSGIAREQSVRLELHSLGLAAGSYFATAQSSDGRTGTVKAIITNNQ